MESLLQPMPEEHLFSGRDAMYDALLSRCTDAIAQDLAAAKRVSLFLSGGNTPVPLYERLARAALPWDAVHPALVDERWVPPEHPDSNEGMLRKIFTDTGQFLQHLTGMYNGAGSALAAEMVCSEHYTQLPDPVSFCLLGMGGDGHTASLFPFAEGLREALETPAPCKAIRAQPSAVTGELTERMTLSLSGILRARRIFLLFTGEDKWRVYEQALASRNPAGMPVAAVLQQDQRRIEVFYSP